LLDADQLVERDAPLSGQAPAMPSPAQPAAPRSSIAGSTLFERMANLSRGAKAAHDRNEDDDEGSSLNIPRFLNRQNNQ
ncbi:MAG: cell division protein FtsZ, partial [Novosphingobium sp.]|nr:cell division protein FtsZ [Novosphingobium sp.]